MLTVLTPATSTDLTVKATVKTLLGLTDTADAILDILIPQATDAVQTYCERVFAQQGYRETVKAYGDNYLMLSRYPIVSVSLVNFQGDVITDYIIEDAPAGLLYRKLGWGWTGAVGWNMTDYILPNSEDPAYQVTYVAGWKLPGDDDRDLPQDLERAVIETVKSWYLTRNRDEFVSQKRVGDLALTYAAPSTDHYGLPPSVLGTLNRYKRSV